MQCTLGEKKKLNSSQQSIKISPNNFLFETNVKEIKRLTNHKRSISTIDMTSNRDLFDFAINKKKYSNKFSTPTVSMHKSGGTVAGYEFDKKIENQNERKSKSNQSSNRKIIEVKSVIIFFILGLVRTIQT